ncbi:MAG: response regulator transcription factor [Acidimicrobiales bacterium]
MESGASQVKAQTVLLVEDDRGLRESLATVLSYQGLTILQSESAEDGLIQMAEHDPDLLVLDVNLPGQDGLHMLRQLRQSGDARQVLLLTARHEVADRVAGLDAGADDYLPKPFALDELLARVRALLRRAESIVDTTGSRSASAAVSGPGTSLGPASTSLITVGDVTIDTSARRVNVQGGRVEVELTKLEYELLVLLASHIDQVMTRSVIQERVWGYDEEYGSNTLEVLVSSLRRKLEADGRSRVVHTVRGVGYVARPASGAATGSPA